MMPKIAQLKIYSAPPFETLLFALAFLALAALGRKSLRLTLKLIILLTAACS